VTDLLLALAHHFLAFSLAALLAAEASILQPGLAGARLRLVAALDAFYGGFAGLIVVVGVGRVIFGIHGPEAFLSNPWFWAKMACFAIVGALSVPPTLRFLAWRRRLKADQAFVVPEKEALAVRRYLLAEIGFFALIPLFAAAMVRVPYL